MDANRTLGGIVFGSGAGPIALYTGSPSGARSLTIDGAGLQNLSAFTQRLWLTAEDFSWEPATLDFRNQATISGDVLLIAIGEGRSVSFHDQASAGTATLNSYTVDFHDNSTAGNAKFDQTIGAIVTFHDAASAGTATLNGNYGLITFADNSSAAKSTLTRANTYATGSSASVVFRDTSSASEAMLSVLSTTFANSATADRAVLGNLGGQVYSSHGAYSTWFANMTFRDQTTAAHANIANNALGFLVFADNSTADHAVIQSTGTVTFSGAASFARARLVAGSGSYFGIGQYNQQAPSVPTGGVYFQDQASGGEGLIEIASAGAWLDFSGLYTESGTTGRAVLPVDSTAAPVNPRDARDISIGAITNSVAGGKIFLGGTLLRLGNTDQSMALSALISDVGGRMGSAAGEPLQGGSIHKAGSGTLVISNPDNDYKGSTLVTGGTLRLDGGRINNAVVCGGARLTGNGTVRGSLENHGQVSPGNSPGTINVTGNYIQQPSGRLVIEIASATSYDRLAVGGIAALGGILTLSSVDGYVPVGNTRFDFLTAGSITGQFGSVDVNGEFGAALAAQLVYAADGVHAQVTQKPFAGFGGDSPAAAGFGGLLDASVAGASGSQRALLAHLNTLDAPELAAALESLAPDRYSVLAANAFATAAAGQTALDRRLAVPPVGAAGPQHALFFEGGYRRASFDADGGLPAAASRLGGGTVGAHWRQESYDLGVTLGYESGVVDLDESGSRADVESLTPQLFFRYAPGNFRFLANAAFSQDEYDLQRRIEYEGASQTALAAPEGRRTDLGVTAGYAVSAGTWSLTPYLGVLASNWELDDFTETGADGANLAISTGSVRSLRTRLGLEAVRRPATSRITPRLVIAWWHEWEDDRSLDASFAGNRYTAAGRKPDEDFLEASLSLDARLGPHTSLFAALGGAWGRNSAITSDFSAGFRWEF